MTPDEAIKGAQAGGLLPIYLVHGEERFLAERVIGAIRAAGVDSAFASMNEDRLTAGEASIDRVLGAARMMPMMAKRRVVLVRGIDRWEGRKDETAPIDAGGDDARANQGAGPLDRLADYAQNPVPSTCLILVAGKLDGRRKLFTLAKKGNFLVACEPLTRNALPPWITRAASAKGHKLATGVADLLAETSGPELAHIADAIERLSLYVGVGGEITEDALSACVVRMRESTVWELVGALGKCQLGRALRALHDVYDPRDRGLRLLGVLAWSVRQLIKFEAAVSTGAGPEDAAKAAGAPPFKARELQSQVREIPKAELERWLGVLASADLALKGSRRPPEAVLQTAVIDMCGTAILRG